jgi:hypothetical protein
VGERLRHDDPPRLPLEPIVADGARRLERGLDVARLEEVPPCRRVPPDSCIAVRLELEPHREGIGRDLVETLSLSLDALRDSQEVLDVVPDLVGDDVRARELARGAEPLAQLLEELEVQVDLAIGRTVEGPDRRARLTAG